MTRAVTQTDQRIEQIRQDAARAAEQREEGFVGQGGGDLARYLARISASTLQSGQQARWDYTIVEIELTATGYQDKADGRTGTAINLRELGHTPEPAAATAWYVWGVNSHPESPNSDYPIGFRPRPVGGGGDDGTHKQDVVVEITQRIDTAGNTINTFQAEGSHDGQC